MKPLYLLIPLTLLLSCKKETIDAVKYNTPVEVHYKLQSSENVPKRVKASLWASDYQGMKRKLVATIDTTVTGSVDLVLGQNDLPYIYCYTSIEVECEKGDIMSLSVESGGKRYLYRSGSCATNRIEFNNEYLKLY